MDTLRPERDELDRFKDRRKKTSDAYAAAPQKAAVKREVSKSNKASPLIVLLLILLVCISSALGWVYIQQQSQLVSLKKELNDAVSFIGQSKLLLARLEGELSETDEAVQQSGSAAKSKLDFLDSEMRKLWGISNDRNKKSIKSNATALIALEERIIDLISSQKKLASDSKLKRSAIEKSLAQLGKDVGQLGSRVSATASEVVISRVELEEDLSVLNRGVASLQKLSAVVGENEKSVASIDASRRQLNERVVELERKLNTMQLQLNNSAKPAIVQ